MPKYILQFETTIRGQVTVDAATEEEAEKLGEQMEQDTLNYDELTDNGKCAPDVETEFTNLYEEPKKND